MLRLIIELHSLKLRELIVLTNSVMVGRKEFNRAFMLYIVENLKDFSSGDEMNKDKILESYRIEVEQLYINEKITFDQKNTWTCPKSVMKVRNLNRALNYGTRGGKKA